MRRPAQAVQGRGIRHSGPGRGPARGAGRPAGCCRIGDDRPHRGMVRGLGLEAAVTFHGFVDEETKIRMFRTTWANVFPSPKEGWGITVMEAAACGTPSIASDSPGLRDSVVAGKTGWLVPTAMPGPWHTECSN
ncbi:MAG: glycosyltransferase [Gemmatimonadales bacterium]